MSAYHIELVNVKTYRSEKHPAQYMGRGTPYGNPYVMRHESERDSVCDAYDEYFEDKVMNDAEFEQAVLALHEKGQQDGILVLACHCKPKRCHIDTIARYLRSLP